VDLQISKVSTKRDRTDLACQCGPAIESYLLSPRNKLPLRPCCSASITPSETLVCQCGLARALCRHRQSRALLPALFTLIKPQHHLLPCRSATLKITSTAPPRTPTRPLSSTLSNLLAPTVSYLQVKSKWHPSSTSLNGEIVQASPENQWKKLQPL
jgi:hypothetical protein